MCLTVCVPQSHILFYFDLSDDTVVEISKGEKHHRRHKSSSDHQHKDKNGHGKTILNGDSNHDVDGNSPKLKDIHDIQKDDNDKTDSHSLETKTHKTYQIVSEDQDPANSDKHSGRHHHKHKHHHKRKHRHDEEKRSGSDRSHRSHSNKSDSPDKLDTSGSSDAGNGSHEKHKPIDVTECGVQVDLRNETESKAAQVPADFESEISEESDSGSSDKNLNKKQQRIAYVQQSISTPRKYNVKPAKVTPKKEGSIYKTEKVPVMFSEEYSTDSQDNKLWRSTIPSISKYKFRDLMHVEQYSNGGAFVCHSYQDEVETLSDEEKHEFVKEYFDFVYGEPEDGVSNCVMGIVHGAARDMPDLLEYLGDEYPNMTVKAGVLGKSDIDTMSMDKYREMVHKSYEAGTFRCGPLLQVSLVGTAHEEVGDYFPEMLDIIENDPFLKAVMPWGELSSVRMASRANSNDGPILWTRPGEQMVPTADMPKSPFKRKRYGYFSLR